MLQYPFAYAESFVYLFQGSPYNSWHKEASAGESLRSKILYLSLFVRFFPVQEVLPNVILLFATFCYSECFLRSRRLRSHCKFRFSSSC